MKGRKSVVTFIVTAFVVSLLVVVLIDIYELKMLNLNMENINYILYAMISKVAIIALLFLISLVFVMNIFNKELNFDYMTGLCSRRKLFYDLNVLINKKANFAICYIDFNDFKYINDLFGHEAGDMLLKTFAERIIDLKHKKITGYRIGGDEFVLILKNINDMEDCVNSIWKVTEKDVDITPNAVAKIKFAMGIAENNFIFTAEELIKQADENMYEKKKA